MKHLPNLNSLRFIAALIVLLGHVNMGLERNGYNYSNFFLFKFPTLAVVLFFVLSGFLITYLLLIEKDKRGISVKKFYLKRILRIWPLYFLIVIVSFAYFNNAKFFEWPELTGHTVFAQNHPVIYSALLVLICPNVLLLFTPYIGYATASWSIGVEEQFYLLWPWLMKTKRPIFYILIIILSVFLLSHGLLSHALNILHVPADRWGVALWYVSNFFTDQFYSFRIDAMAIGALGAFIAHRKSELLQNIFSKSFQIFVYIILILLTLFGRFIPYQFFSIIFILIILNLAFNKNNILNLENKVLDYLGRISYGIYMYHMITIMPSIYLCLKVFSLPQTIYTELLIMVISLITTILIASLSYRFFEGYFLKIKDRLRYERNPYNLHFPG